MHLISKCTQSANFICMLKPENRPLWMVSLREMNLVRKNDFQSFWLHSKSLLPRKLYMSLAKKYVGLICWGQMENLMFAMLMVGHLLKEIPSIGSIVQKSYKRKFFITFSLTSSSNKANITKDLVCPLKILTSLHQVLSQLKNNNSYDPLFLFSDMVIDLQNWSLNLNQVKENSYNFFRIIRRSK